MVDDSTNREQEAPPGNVPGSSPAPESSGQEDLKRQYEELNDRFLRLAADFENFRKRAAREEEQLTKSANKQLAADMLEVIDNLDRAVRSDESHLREGLEQIRALCSSILERYGVTPIDSCEKAFDPTIHEAIAHVPSDKPEGIIIDELCRGYRMHDKVIRFAKVAVSKGNGK